MIDIKLGRVCIKCWLSKKWCFFYEKPGSKFWYYSSCKVCVDAEQRIRRSIAKLAEHGYATSVFSNIDIKPFKHIPKEPEKVIPLNTKNWEKEKIENYWENEKKYWKVIIVWMNPISDLYTKI